MDTSTVKLAVVDGKTVTQAAELHGGAQGAPVKVRAIKGGKFVLADQKTGHAPENVTVKRVGKDLHVALEGDAAQQPSLIIEDYYGSDSQLAGVAEDGAYHEYVVNGAGEEEASLLADGASAPAELSAQPLAGMTGLVAAPAVASFPWAASLLGLGALGMVGAAVAGGNGGDNGINADGQREGAGVVDTTPPAPGTIVDIIDDVGIYQGTIVPGTSTDDSTPTLTGRAEAGTTVIIRDGNTVIGSVVANADGTWRYTPDNPLNDGTYNFNVIVRNAAGIVSDPSATWTVIVDTVPPGLPFITEVIDNVGDQTGPLESGDVTDDTTPTLRGTAEAGSLVILYERTGTGARQPVGSTHADASGNWEITPSALLNGTHRLDVRAFDAAGNWSRFSAPFDLTIMTGGIPTAPAIINVIDDVGSVTGNIAPGGVTDDTRPTVVGTAQPGAVVRVYDVVDGNEVLLGSTIADANGRWEFTPDEAHALAEGQHNLKATAELGGQISPPTGLYPIEVDLTAPGALNPPELIDDVGSIQGPIHSGDTTDDANPTFQGTGGDPGDTIVIRDNGTIIGTTIVKEDGSWEFTPATPLPDGDHSFTAQPVDPVGNAGPITTPIDFRVETGAVEVSITSVIDDKGPVTGPITPGGVTDDDTPTLNGRATPNGIVKLYDGETLLGSTVANADGTWTFTVTTPALEGEGEHTLRATVTVPGQAESDPATFGLVLDTVAPQPGTIDDVYDDVGTKQGTVADGGVTDDSTPTLSGTAEAGATVIVRNGDEVIGSTIANGEGKWSYTPENPLADGAYDFNIIVRDAAGNSSEPSDPWAVIIDTDIPTPSIGDVWDNTDPSNLVPIEDGGVTKDRTPVIGGEGSTPGDTIIVIVDDEVVGSTIVGDDGKWEFEIPTDLEDGKHKFEVVEQDEAGNSAKSDPVTVIVDGTPPGALNPPELIDDVGDITGPIHSGDTTDDTKPTFQGTGGEPGDTIVVRDNGTIIGTTIVKDDGSWTFEPETPLTDGDHSFTAQPVDPAGNAGPETAPIDFVVDTTVPTIAISEVIDDEGSVTGAIAAGGVTDDTTPTLNGTATPNGIVKLYDGDKLLGSTVANADGTWTFTVTEPKLEGDGTHTLKATVTIPGQAESAPDTFDLVLDTTAPGALNPPELIDDVGSIQGPIHSGDTTDDTKPTFQGTGGEPGDTIVVRDNGTIIGTTIVKDDGSWTFEPETPLTDGDHSFTAQPVDPAGNAGPETDPIDFVVDTTVPTVAITEVIDDEGSVTGAIAAGGVTDDTTPTLNGTATPNGIVKLYDGDKLLGSTVANVDGSWTFTVTTPALEGDGTHTLKATVTIPGQAESAPDTFDLVLDTTAPGALNPPELIDDVGDITGPIHSGDTTDDTKPTFQGTGGEPGDTIVVRDNGTIIGTTIVGEDGSWTFEPETPLANGDHSFTAQPVDPAGNAGPETAPIDFVVDTTVPTIAITEVIDDEGSVTGAIAAGGVTDDTTPTLNGTATPNGIVKLYDGDKLLGSTVANVDGSWTFTVTTPALEGDGTHTLKATVTIPGQAESAPDTFDLVLDTTAPGALNPPELIDDVGSIQGPIHSGDTTDDTKPTFQGTGGEPGDTIVVRDNGTIIGTTIVKDDGSWTFEPETPLADGDHSFTAQPIDPAGNAGPETAPIDFVVDTVALPPVITSVIDDVAGGIVGDIPNGGLTNDSTPTLNGTAEPGATVRIQVDGGTSYTVTASASGAWSFTPPALTEGTHTFSVTQTDIAGNTSGAATRSVVVDLHADAPVITSVIDDVAGGIVGNIPNGGLTNDRTPTLNGTAEAGATVRIQVDGGTVYSVTANASGAWTFTPPALADGTHTFSVSQTDVAGNTSGAATRSVVVDATVVAPVITSVIDDVAGGIVGNIPNGGLTNDRTPTLNGTAEANAVVRIQVDGGTVYSVTANASGAWTFTPPALADGTHTFSVSQTDVAGNTSGAATRSVVVDATVVAPVITSVIDDVAGGIVGNIPNGGLTNDRTPTLNGTAEANAVVRIQVDGGTIYSVTANASGVWTFTPPSLADGTHTFSVSQTDPAGNTSGATTRSVVVDATVVAPVITSVIDDVGPVTGNIPNAGTTDDNTPTLNGTAEPGATVRIQVDGGTAYTVTANASGNWTFTPPALSLGSHTFSVTQTDLAGNTSTATTRSLTVVSPLSSGSEDFNEYAVGGRPGPTGIPTNGGSVTTDSGLRISATLSSGGSHTRLGLDPIGGTSRTDAAIAAQRDVTVRVDFGQSGTTDVSFRVVQGFGNGGGTPAERDGGTVRFYSPTGELLGTQNYTFFLTNPINISFVAPAGKTLGYMVWTNSGVPDVYEDLGWSQGLDDFVWGTRVPRSGTMDTTESAVDDEAANAAALSEDKAEQDASPVEDAAAAQQPKQDEPQADDAAASKQPESSTLPEQEASQAEESAQAENAPVVQQPGQVIEVSDVAELDTLEIKGTEGVIDTLKLTGENQVLDLSKLEGVSSVEVIDITGTGDNTLKLNLSDVLEQGGKDLFIADGKTQMMVKGNEGDTVELSDLLKDGSDIGDWAQQAGTVTVEGEQYNVYYHEATNVELLVQLGVTANLDNH
ncbi:Ig-like domain-containing protein [Ralstonia sp. 24A2]|uniref:Ig-like domain-containing protein n=1 Tax=Ralstonia sp. 24A2 TaxID=3447364 RepID=UPI003F698B00